MLLSPDEVNYYARQIILSEIGKTGQLKLKNARVLCIGAGGLGAPLLQYLAAAGVGTIGIIDHDVVEISNLSRQIIYKYSDLGNKKVIAARDYLTQLNPFIIIKIYPQQFNVSNASCIISDYDIVADCTDDLVNRHITNQVCVELDKPFVFAGIWHYQGQCMLFHRREGPCFNCLFPFNNISQSLPNCNDAGVLGVLPGLLGTMQANLILQHILQMSDKKIDKLFTLNGRNFELISYQVERDHNCTVCVLHQNIHKELSFIHHTISERKSISFESMRNKIERGEKFALLDVRSVEEHAAYNLGGMLIPLQELENRLPELDKTLPVIIYCQSGQRSQAAAAILKKHHFISVLTLDHHVSLSL